MIVSGLSVGTGRFTLSGDFWFHERDNRLLGFYWNGNVEQNPVLFKSLAIAIGGRSGSWLQQITHVSDASEATLTGSAGDLVCSVTDASKLRFKGMRCCNVVVDNTDASDADVYVSGRLTGKVTDASKLVYYGNAVQGILSVKDASKVVRGD